MKNNLTLIAAVNISKEYAFGDLTSLGQGLDRLVLPTFSIAAFAVIIYFIIAGFKYLSSGGDKEELAKAQGMITHAIIGFMLLIALFLVVNFLFARLFGTGIQFIEGLQK
ncbi:MAG: hypothetical protein Q7R49_06440 [Candidatus Daviesbacteria bacterium]|nr:hypothetical protein [Candidatus Daviesbacteria bacterium]